MAPILRKPSKEDQSQSPNPSTARSALQYGVGPYGLEGQQGDHEHPEWWQWVSRAYHEDSDCDPWPLEANVSTQGNQNAMMRDLATLLLTDFALYLSMLEPP